MNFLSMDYFITLARERNFTRAAEKLHITQQTLSAHISNLEKETGAPLFLR
ncbi:MAG: LysR family transcriptional regulator, partial [Acidaminococcaceae bacterium]|nr:LysR family transcriptional regulator [Acidaminococcaceae bacterium]